MRDGHDDPKVNDTLTVTSPKAGTMLEPLEPASAYFVHSGLPSFSEAWAAVHTPPAIARTSSMTAKIGRLHRTAHRDLAHAIGTRAA